MAVSNANLQNGSGSFHASFGDSTVVKSYNFGDGLFYDSTKREVSVDSIDELIEDDIRPIRSNAVINAMQPVTLAEIQEMFQEW